MAISRSATTQAVGKSLRGEIMSLLLLKLLALCDTAASVAACSGGEGTVVGMQALHKTRDGVKILGAWNGVNLSVRTTSTNVDRLCIEGNAHHTCRIMSSPGRMMLGERFCTSAIVPAGEHVLNRGTLILPSAKRALA